MNIEQFCKEYNLGNTKNITKLTGGLMHKMFKVETDKGTYCIKVLNKEVMSRSEAYDNFVISEKISNYVKDNKIPVSNAININGNYLNKYEDNYYMVFEYVEGKTLSDNEITIEHCKKIGKILGQIHSLDYKEIELESNIVEYKKLYDWEGYINNPYFESMSYKQSYLDNYKKYNSILKRANERFNASNQKQALCHRDLDPKNVMWKDEEPIIIDWESAGVANPHREVIETALCFSGFLSNNFDENKFKALISEYSKVNPIEHKRYDLICGNLVGRFGWLKYNLERSLRIVTDDEEEIKLAEKEVSKTIDEINRYLELIGPMYDILCDMTKKEDHTYDEVIEKIIESNDMLQGLKYKKINAGYTNVIYKVGNYIVRLCTDENNEYRFKNEIDFYNINKDNEYIPKLYHYDISKKDVNYYYQIQECIEGIPLYEVWYKLNDNEKEDIVRKIINIIKPIHQIKTEEYDFNEFIKDSLKDLIEKAKLEQEDFITLFELCNKYFKENIFGFVHADLHFDNFIYNNGTVKLIDFERAISAPIDYDFKIFNVCLYKPWKWASSKTDMLTVEKDYANLIKMFLDNYEQLRSIKYINERLNVYTLIEFLKDYNYDHSSETLDDIKTLIKTLK